MGTAQLKVVGAHLQGGHSSLHAPPNPAKLAPSALFIGSLSAFPHSVYCAVAPGAAVSQYYPRECLQAQFSFLVMQLSIEEVLATVAGHGTGAGR